jgi:hypothetical protein
MAAAAMLEIQVHAIKWAITTRFRCKLVHRLKNILSSKVLKAEMTDRSQNGRRRHVGNSSACYKMGNCHPTLMQIGT